MLVAQDLHLADLFRDAPLIYPTLLKSFVFTIVLASRLVKKPLSLCFMANRCTRVSRTLGVVLGREF